MPKTLDQLVKFFGIVFFILVLWYGFMLGMNGIAHLVQVAEIEAYEMLEDVERR